MRTGIKYHQLAGMPQEQAYKALAGAIAFHLAKNAIGLDILGKRAAQLSSARIVGLKKPDDATISRDRVKAALTSRYKYSTPSDNPELAGHVDQVVEYVHENMPERDLGFMLAFDEVDLRASTASSFDIISTSAGLTWQQRKAGDVTKIRRKYAEDKVTVEVIEYSEGLGLLDQWLQFQQFWNIDEAIAEFVATYYDNMAKLHYDLITAISAGQNVAFDTDDVTTANKAAAAILRSLDGKLSGVSMNSGLIAYCAVEHVGRLEKMLTAQRGSAIVDQGTVSQPLTARITNIVGTTKIPAASTGWYLGLPGHKNKHGRWKDLTTESARSIYTSAEDIVGVGQFNAAIGEQNQWRRVLFA